MATSKKSSSASKGGASSAAFGLPSLDDLTKMMQQFKLPGVDVNALIEWQRRDLEALAEANREAYEGYKALIERRNEILQETFSHWQQNVRDSMGADAMSKQSEAAQASIQKAVENFRELSQMEAEARSRAWRVVQDRLQENMKNLQTLLKSE